MTIIGIGIDLVDMAPFATLYGHNHTDLSRVFSDRELTAVANDEDRLRRLAARFAAKEAVLKVLGTGIQDEMAYADIEVVHTVLGAPHVEITGATLAVADRLGITSWQLSMSYADSLVAAVAVGSSGGPR